MKKGYTPRLVARNEGIEYRDQFDVYRFNVKLVGRKWTVLLPGSQRGGRKGNAIIDRNRVSRKPLTARSGPGHGHKTGLYVGYSFW